MSLASSAAAGLNLHPGKDTSHGSSVSGFEVAPENNVVFMLLSWFILFVVGTICGWVRCLKHLSLSPPFNPCADVVMRNF